ncbi:MAG: glycosyltransferase family 39 protein [Candidatus Omnitrophica bacterium]|nr:glycosyltransferase family 39 protein [Candidatus Omnitrophota bacterium]
MLRSGRVDHRPQNLLGNPWFWFFALLIVTTVRFAVAASHPLFETECYYWMYSQNLGFGYFDHPPMLGFFLHFFNFWDPPSSLAARLHCIVSHFFCSIFLYYYGRNLFDSAKAGIGAALLFNIIPIYSILAIQNQPDAPLMFFWCATLLCFERSVSTGKPLWWILAGFMAGGALLSKFHAVPLVGSLFLHLLFFGKDRKHLATPWPYIGFAVALSCYLPNFIWNAQNGWITYEFQFDRLAEAGEFKPVHLLGVFLAPLLLLSPWVYGLVAVVATRIAKQFREGLSRGMALSFWSSVPLFLFFVYVSFSDSVKIHWTAPAFIGLLPAVAVTLQQWSGRRRFMFCSSAMVMTLLIYGYLVFPFLVSQSLPNSWLPPTLKAEFDEHLDKDWTSQNYGFDRLGKFLKEQLDAGGEGDFDLIASWRFDRVATAAFYAGEPDRAFVPAFGDRRGYTLWESPYIRSGANALYVSRSRKSESRTEREFEDLRDCFNQIGDPIVVEAPFEGHPFREFEVYPCYGLRKDVLIRLAKRDF